MSLLTSREFHEGTLPVRRMRLRHRGQHHRIPTSRGGTDDPSNLLNMWDSTHEALHTVFGDRMPHEQIDRILALNAPVMKDRIRRKIRTLLFTKKLYIPEARSQKAPERPALHSTQLISLLQENQRAELLSFITSDAFLESSHPNFPTARRHNNDHHLIPQSRGGPDDSLNVREWNKPTHEAFHIMFENRTPDEQISYLLSLNGPVLNPALTTIIRNTLRRTRFYIPEALQWMQDAEEKNDTAQSDAA